MNSLYCAGLILEFNLCLSSSFSSCLNSERRRQRVCLIHCCPVCPTHPHSPAWEPAHTYTLYRTSNTGWSSTFHRCVSVYVCLLCALIFICAHSYNNICRLAQARFLKKSRTYNPCALWTTPPKETACLWGSDSSVPRDVWVWDMSQQQYGQRSVMYKKNHKFWSDCSDYNRMVTFWLHIQFRTWWINSRRHTWNSNETLALILFY